MATLYPLRGHSPCQLAWAVCPGSGLATLQPWFWRRILGRGWWWKCIMEHWQIFWGKTVPSNELWEEDLPNFYCRWTRFCWWHIHLIRWQQRSCIDVVKLRPLNLKLWWVNKCWTSPLHQRHYTADIIAPFLLTMILDVTRTRWCRVRLPFQEMEVPTLQVEKWGDSQSAALGMLFGSLSGHGHSWHSLRHYYFGGRGGGVGLGETARCNKYLSAVVGFPNILELHCGCG